MVDSSFKPLDLEALNKRAKFWWHPWHEWFSGQEVSLKSGKDFAGDTVKMQNLVYAVANKMRNAGVLPSDSSVSAVRSNRDNGDDVLTVKYVGSLWCNERTRNAISYKVRPLRGSQGNNGQAHSEAKPEGNPKTKPKPKSKGKAKRPTKAKPLKSKAKSSPAKRAKPRGKPSKARSK